MQPSVPLAEELENVPRGHGNNVAIVWLLSRLLLNPEAKRAEKASFSERPLGTVILIASFRELTGFLRDNISLF